MGSRPHGEARGPGRGDSTARSALWGFARVSLTLLLSDPVARL